MAGAFYPENARRLAQLVDSLLAAAHPASVRPKAVIAPHAGYVYSGPIAARAYAAAPALNPKPTNVVLLGPARNEP